MHDQPAILRNYSLSGAPEDGVYRISVRKNWRASAALFCTLG
jgi:ferredoxin-NADP reductase